MIYRADFIHGPLATMRRRLARLRPTVALAGLLLGCPAGSGESTGDSHAQRSPPAKVSTVELRGQAHLDMLRELVPLAQTLMRLHDPTGAAALRQDGDHHDHAHVGTPALSAQRRAQLFAAQEAAERTAKGLEPTVLPPAAKMIARGIRFELNRVRDETQRHRPSRTDPTWFFAEAMRAVDRLEHQVRDGAGPLTLEDIGQFPRELRAALIDLGASSPASLTAAIADLTAIRTRYAALPLAPEAATAVASAADEAHTYFTRASAALPAAKLAEHRLERGRAKGPETLARLPDRLGAKVLARRLEVEENLAAPPVAMFRKLGPALHHMNSMLQARRDYAPTNTAPATVARCERLRTRLTEHLTPTKALPQVALSCAEALKHPRLRGYMAADAMVSDGEILVALVDLAVVHPHREARRASEGLTIALLSGRIAQRSQALSMRLALLTGFGDDEATSIALHEAIDAACLAATALWIHGELGGDSELTKQIQSRCPARQPQVWIDAAQARPRAALAGLALGRLGAGPAELVALDRYWWAPVGLLDALADPRELTAPIVPKRADIKIHPLGPAPQTPDP